MKTLAWKWVYFIRCVYMVKSKCLLRVWNVKPFGEVREGWIAGHLILFVHVYNHISA